jgi:hypothetical protein
MFPSTIDRRQNKRSLRELVRGAMDTALEFVTLGEAHLPAKPAQAPREHVRRTPAVSAAVHPHAAAAAPTAEHPHRRQLDHRRVRRRPGMVPPRPQVCTSPVHRPATHRHT